MKNGPIIDNHVHLYSSSWFYPGRPIFERKMKENRRRKINHPTGVDYGRTHLSYMRKIWTALNINSAAELLIDDMDDAGIDIAVLMGMDYDMTGNKLRIQHWDQLNQLAEVRDNYSDRFLLFCGMDLRRGEKGLVLFEEAVKELKCVGLKLLPHWGFYPNDRELAYPYYEKCVEWNIPVASNCSAIGDSHVAHKYCDPLLFEDVAYDFPEMNICLAHSGYPYDIEYAFTLAGVKQNIYIDIGDWQSKSPYDIKRLIEFVHRAMNSPVKYKIMFASDWPVFRRMYSEREWVDLFTTEAKNYGFNFTDEELNLFFSENAQDYLDLNL